MFRLSISAGLVGAALLLPGAAMATQTYFEGFNGPGHSFSSGGNYGTVTLTDEATTGIAAFEGTGFAGITEFPYGPYTTFSGGSSVFPGAFTTSAAIYLDTGWAAGSGFDYSVAMNQQSGSHLRDFIFHVTQDSSTGALLVGGSNNTDFIPKESIEAGNHYTVTTSGWYVFEHSFYDLGGSLAVDLNLYDSASNLLFTETRNNPGDLMASVVGGNRYGWFTSVEVGGDLYVDAVSMDVTAPAVPLPAGLPLMIGAFAGFGLLARRRRD